MVKLADIFRTHGYAYLKKFQQNILPSHRKAIYDICACRTPVMGGQVYKCNKCNVFHFSYHSCGNRSCNTCKNNKAEEWLNKNNGLLLPVNYFMVTFTLPEELRQIARSNSILFYKILFDASSGSIDKLSPNPKYLGGKPGYLGVLHTWSRKLAYHPHIHYIITAGGLSKEKDNWITANNKFLFPVKALSAIFKAKFRDQLKLKAPKLFNQISPDIWRRNWVVNSIAVGNGSHAMKYLAQYVFRVAISNNRIIKHEDGYVTFKYKDSKTKIWKFIRLTTEEFIRRFLQHVLPPGFVKVRYFGLFSTKNRSLLNKTKELLPLPDIKLSAHKTKQKITINYCPKCGEEMKLILEFNRINWYSGSLKNLNKAPPCINNLSINNEQIQKA